MLYKFITNISCLVEGGDQLKVKVVIKPNVVIKLVKVVINVVISLSKKGGQKSNVVINVVINSSKKGGQKSNVVIKY